MSQFILDEQLAASEILVPLQKRHKVQRLRDLRPGEQILDDRIPEILLTLKKPSFITIDQGFWSRAWCHPDYAILYFALRDEERIPERLLAFLRHPEFRTRNQRMGKVFRISKSKIEFWEYSSQTLEKVFWQH